MFKVLDQRLQFVSEWSSLAAAKEAARIRANEFPSQVWFVCDAAGSIWAGFGGTR